VGRWLADILRITDDGTEYVQPSKIVLPIMTAPSHHVPHLQPADFVIATTAVIAGRKAGLDLKELLAKVMHLHSPGDVNGAGVVLSARLQPLLPRFRRDEPFAMPKAGEPYCADDALGDRPASAGTPTDDAHEHRLEPAIRPTAIKIRRAGERRFDETFLLRISRAALEDRDPECSANQLRDQPGRPEPLC
jgi:hypothetical protein